MRNLHIIKMSSRLYTILTLLYPANQQVYERRHFRVEGARIILQANPLLSIFRTGYVASRFLESRGARLSSPLGPIRTAQRRSLRQRRAGKYFRSWQPTEDRACRGWERLVLRVRRRTLSAVSASICTCAGAAQLRRDLEWVNGPVCAARVCTSARQSRQRRR